MKKFRILPIILYLIIAIFSFAGSYTRMEKIENKQVKDNVVYIKDESKPFTGKLVGEESLEEYRDGIRDGFFKRKILHEGKDFICEGKYIEGIKHGMWTIKYPDGKHRAILEYSYDKPCGQWRYFYENNQIESFENFENGILSGEVKFFDKNGNLMIRANYLEGLLNGSFLRYYSPKKIETATNFSYGKINGTIKIFSKEGTLLMEGNYKENIRENTWRIFYKTGDIKTVFSYKNGKKEGEAIIYDKAGLVVQKSLFKDGKEVGVESSKKRKEIFRDKIVDSFKKFNRDLKYQEYDKILLSL